MTELAVLRKKTGLTQKQIANQIGISPKAWQSYETGFRTPKPAVMQKIEDYFDVPKEIIFATAFNYKM